MINLVKLSLGGFRLIRRDPMLVLLLVAPWLAGAALGFGLPLLAPLLLSAFGFDLAPWYGLMDLLMLMLTPLMAGMLAGMLMLDERDEGVGGYYAVTPIGGARYLISRMALPVLWSVLVAPCIMALFSLSDMPYVNAMCASFVGGLAGATMSLLLLAFAGNKVEGLAVAKLLGLVLMPVLLPFFTNSPWALFAGIFPAYWMGAAAHTSAWLALPGVGVSLVWLYLLYRRAMGRQG